jgi:protein arginine kinase activator
MKCQFCQESEATIHLTEINDGARSEMHLCEHCAVEQGIAVKSQIPLNELLSSLLAAQPEEDDLSAESERKQKCPHCGFSIEQFRKDAVLGCPYDYEIFEKSLLPLIEKAHNGKTTHAGKVPTTSSVDTKKQVELMMLRQRLEQAVKSEDYELAAELRDKINQLE